MPQMVLPFPPLITRVVTITGRPAVAGNGQHDPLYLRTLGVINPVDEVAQLVPQGTAQ